MLQEGSKPAASPPPGPAAEQLASGRGARSQRAAPAESLATLRTGERPLLAVGLLVKREVGLLAEGLATVSALRRLLARPWAACGAGAAGTRV